MLYPDLRRLSLLCPTGANNDHEASGSNDPLPPRPQRARVDPEAEPEETGQERVLRTDDLMQLILYSAADGDFQTLCTAAARWCNLNKVHRNMCDDSVWKQLTTIVFPNAREPIPYRSGHLPEPTGPKRWFIYLCKQHKKLRDLKNELERRTLGIEDLVGSERDWYRAHADNKRLAEKQTILYEVRRLGQDVSPEVRAAIEARLEANRLAMVESADRMRDADMVRGARWERLYSKMPKNEEWEQMLRQIDKQECYIRDLEPDPAVDPASPEAKVERLRQNVLKQRMHDYILRQRAEKERMEKNAQRERWLAAEQAKDRRDAILTATMERAQRLLRTAPVAARDLKAEVRLQLRRIERERADYGTFSNRPAVMERLAQALRSATDALQAFHV